MLLEMRKKRLHCRTFVASVRFGCAKYLYSVMDLTGYKIGEHSSKNMSLEIFIFIRNLCSSIIMNALLLYPRSSGCESYLAILKFPAASHCSSQESSVDMVTNYMLDDPR
jgi:hypothetical protein